MSVSRRKQFIRAVETCISPTLSFSTLPAPVCRAQTPPPAQPRASLTPAPRPLAPAKNPTDQNNPYITLSSRLYTIKDSTRSSQLRRMAYYVMGVVGASNDLPHDLRVTNVIQEPRVRILTT